MSSEMLEAARVGYYGNQNPHIYSSPLWYAHEVGAWLHRRGSYIPTRECRMSRGYSVRVDGVVYRAREVAGEFAGFEVVS